MSGVLQCLRSDSGWDLDSDEMSGGADQTRASNGFHSLQYHISREYQLC